MINPTEETADNDSQPEFLDDNPPSDLTNIRHDVTEDVEGVIQLTKGQMTLKEMRHNREISEHNFDLNELFNFVQHDVPLTKNDLENRPIVLTREEFEQLGGCLTITFSNGEDIIFEVESMTEPVLIIFPQDLG